jgi:hypothetical protein
MGTIRRRAAHGWEGVTAKEYPAFPGVEKHELIEGQSYRVRYFHVPAATRRSRAIPTTTAS